MRWEDLPESLNWDRRLAYFLDPAKQNEITREELQEALAILTSLYCDEHYNLRFLECYIEEHMGEDKLEQIIENGIRTDAVLDRYAVVIDEEEIEDRMIAARDMVNRIADEYDDLAAQDREENGGSQGDWPSDF